MGWTNAFETSFLGHDLGYFVGTLLLVLLIALPVMVGVAMAVYADRKVWAAMQLRRGPNVVGPFGLLQTFADALKLFLKETIIPSGANTGVFLIAPMITFTLALIAWAVIPFDAGVVLANINVGLLYLFAVSSMGVYGIIMSGWASNSKFPFLGGLRSAAQMVSYEVSIGFVIVCVVLYASRVGGPAPPRHGGGARGVHGAQRGRVQFVDDRLLAAGRGAGVPQWQHLQPAADPDGGGVLHLGALAETNRPPFDLPEAEA